MSTMPLFSASHAAKWDALSTSSTVPSSQDDHVHDIWHWHPSQWPLVLERTSSGSSAHTKTLLLSSRVQSGADLRYNHSSLQADDHAHKSAGNGHRPAQSLPSGCSVFGEPVCNGGGGGHCRAGDNVSSWHWQHKSTHPTERTANGNKRSYVSHSGQHMVSLGPDSGRLLTSFKTIARSNSHWKKMAVKTYTWVSLWFLITAPIIFWDASYCFMR